MADQTKKNEVVVHIAYGEVQERSAVLVKALQPPGWEKDLSTEELRRQLLRDTAAATIARHLLVSQLEQLGVPRMDAIDYTGQLAMTTLKKLQEPEKKVIQ